MSTASSLFLEDTSHEIFSENNQLDISDDLSAENFSSITGDVVREETSLIEKNADTALLETIDTEVNDDSIESVAQRLPDRLHYNEWPKRTWHRRFLRALSEGNSVTGAAREARITVGAVYAAKSRKPEFAKAWDFHYRTVGGDKFEDFVLINAEKGNTGCIKMGLQLRGRLVDESNKGSINIQINQAYADVVTARFAAQAQRRLEE